MTPGKFGSSIVYSPDPKAVETSLETLIEAGFTHAELPGSAWGIWLDSRVNTPQLKRMTEVTDRFRDRLRYTIHGPIAFHLMDQRDFAARARLLRAGIEATRAFGAEIMVYESGWVQEWPAGGGSNMSEFMNRERELLRDLGEEMAAWDGKLAIETMAAAEFQRAYSDSPWQLAEHVAEIDHPGIGICIDTGHSFLGANRLGYDFVEGMKVMAPWVFTFHLQDNFGRWPAQHLQLNHRSPESWALGLGDLHLPPGWGAIPFEAMFAEADFARDPVLMMEINFDLYHQLLPELRSRLESWAKHQRAG